MKEYKDKELVRLAKDGSEEAFSELYKRHYEKMMGVVFKFTKNTEDSEDLVSQTFMKAYINLHRFKEQCAFSTWLYRIATNNAKNFLMAKPQRVHKVSIVPKDLEHKFTDHQDPESHLHIEEVKEFFNNEVSELPEELRDVFVLADYDKMKYREIGELLDLKVGTVRSRLHKARGIVYGNFEQFGDEE